MKQKLKMTDIVIRSCVAHILNVVPYSTLANNKIRQETSSSAKSSMWSHYMHVKHYKTTST